MAYSKIQIWDGTNNATVASNGGINVNDVTSAPSAVTSETTVMVGLSITLIGASNATRNTAWVANKGTSGVWLSSKSTMTTGATGVNFVELTAGSNFNYTQYAGAIYGRVVGVSGDYQPVGFIDIG